MPIIRARALDQALDHFDRAADKWISDHMTDEHKRLEREKLDWAKAESTKPENLRDKFPLKKFARLRQVSETLHNRKAITRMRAKRARWLRDKVHQISAKVVKLAIQRGAAVVVIGLRRQRKRQKRRKKPRRGMERETRRTETGSFGRRPGRLAGKAKRRSP